MAQRRRFALLKQPFTLDSLGDVNITAPSAGQLLEYDGTDWVNVDFSALSDFAEAVDDRVAALMVAGNNIDVTYDDALNTFTISVEALTSGDISDFSEAVDDRVGSLLVAGNNIDLTYNDGSNTLTIDVEALTSGDISDFTEAAQDAVGAMVVTSGEGVDLVYTDGTPALAANLDINGLTAESTVDSAADYFVMYDASASAHRKVLGSNMPGGGSGSSGSNTYATNDGVAVLRAATVQSLANNTNTAVTFDTELRDDGTYATLGTNNDRLTVANAGWYTVTGTCGFASNSTGYRQLSFRVSGTAVYYGYNRIPAVSGDNTWMTITATMYLAAGDYVQLMAEQNSGGALDLTLATTLAPRLSAHRLAVASSSANPINDGARVKRTTNQSISNGVQTSISFDTEVRDDGGYATLGTSATRLTVTNAGWYTITAGLEWGVGSNGSRYALLLKNGATVLSIEARTAGSGDNKQNLASVAYLAAGDYVTLDVIHSETASLNVLAQNDGPFLSLHRLGTPPATGALSNATRTVFETDLLPGEMPISSTAGVGRFHSYVLNGGTFAYNTVTDATRLGILTLRGGTSSNSSAAVIGLTSNVQDTGGSVYLLDADDLVLDYLMRVSSVSVTTGFWHVGMVDDVDTYANHFRVYLDAGVVKLVSAKSGAGTSTTNFTTEPTANAWHHIQLRASSTSIRAYMDGVLQATVTGANIPTAGMFPVFQVGNNGSLADVQLDIDYFRLSKTYSTARSSTLST